MDHCTQENAFMLRGYQILLTSVTNRSHVMAIWPSTESIHVIYLHTCTLHVNWYIDNEGPFVWVYMYCDVYVHIDWYIDNEYPLYGFTMYVNILIMEDPLYGFICTY